MAIVNEHVLNKIVRTHTLLCVLIARLDCLGRVQKGDASEPKWAISVNKKDTLL